MRACHADPLILTIAKQRYLTWCHLGQEVPSNKAEVFTLTLPDACSKGDLNDDGWIDVRDYPLFESCLAGPDAAWPDAACSRADFDDDTDTDLADFSDSAPVFEQP